MSTVCYSTMYPNSFTNGLQTAYFGVAFLSPQSLSLSLPRFVRHPEIEKHFIH